MKQTTCSKWLVIVGVVSAFIATDARAQTLSDVFNKSEAARSAASAARTAANSARTQAEAAKTVAQRSLNRAIEARDAAEELRDNARMGIGALVGSLRDAVDEAVEDAQSTIDDLRSGRDAFVDGPDGCSNECSEFRDDLVAIVGNINSLMNAAFIVGGLPDMAIDASRPISLLERIPGRALYPAYRALAVESNLFGSGFVERMVEAADAIVVLDLVLNQSAAGGAAASGALAVGGGSLVLADVDECQYVRDHPKAANGAVFTLAKSSILMKAVGGVLKNLGEKAPDSTIGIHGYTLFTIKDPSRLEEWGERMEKVSEVLTKIAEAADDKVDDCTATELTQIALEQQLVRCRKLAGLYLPGEQGGHLETAQNLVAARLDGAEDAGVAVDDARGSKSSGDTKMAAGKFFPAYKDFCRAYKQMNKAAAAM